MMCFGHSIGGLPHETSSVGFLRRASSAIFLRWVGLLKGFACSVLCVLRSLAVSYRINVSEFLTVVVLWSARFLQEGFLNLSG